MTQKAIHMVFGSESDLEHVRKIIGYLNQRGWKYTDMPLADNFEKAYIIRAGSVHRDVMGTLNSAKALTEMTDGVYRSIFLTCIGLRDEASGVTASYTGKRVVACPPDAKDYGKYPGGVRVVTFSNDAVRENDIVAALNWIETEFENPNWDADDATARKTNEDKHKALETLRLKLEDGAIKF